MGMSCLFSCLTQAWTVVTTTWTTSVMSASAIIASVSAIRRWESVAEMVCGDGGGAVCPVRCLKRCARNRGVGVGCFLGGGPDAGGAGGSC